ncbi:glycoside hydrolase family 3 N-terminal domain-containing protein [Flavivirga rizhaonensis]|uniref:Beta-glucosidase n=1 Tax=Flavivirga rizhaonensis TaxID=2559571 RepID=A0A4V3P568_9FLAO|nr:glycoside hydrolase family 3 N-terminal domain-containing protein [Flavivirga rizhaonensis]TGV04184.1 beta-glucosidase [Flavivirga rizhaonensis]
MINKYTMTFNKTLLCFIIFLFFILEPPLVAQNADNSIPFSTAPIDAKVEAIMSKMTLQEKLAQIEGIRPMLIMEDGKFSEEKFREVIPHGIGHICQFSSSLAMSPNELRDFVREVQHYLMTETKTKIPAIFHEEAITGFATQGATTYPQQIGMGCTWNPELITKIANTTRQNMRAAGATYALSPMLDISRTAHWERIEESYGEDAYLTSLLGVSFIKGLQGDDFRTGVATTTKHFAGYGSQNDNVKELYEEYVMPHEAAMKVAGSKSVMPSYGKYKGLAVAANKEMLTDILRTHLKFDGVVISDYGAISLIHSGHKQATSVKEAAVMALKAGIDIEVSKPIAFPFLPEALDEGLIQMETIDAAVRKSLIMKAKLGLLDKNPQIGVDQDLDFDPPAFRQLAYEGACQSIVLLKNNGILPLKKEVKKIGLLGPNGSTVHCMLGDYTYQSMQSFWWGNSFNPNDPKIVTLHEGLKSKLAKDVEIMQERGCDWSAPLESIVKMDNLGDSRLAKVKMIAIKGVPQPDLNKAVQIASKSDVIVAAVGENIYLCGEGRERKGIRLPGEQEAFVQKLIDTGKPLVLVIFGGRQQLVSKFEDKCAAIVQAWFPGEEGGNAIADVLLGNVNPSGKLCVSYPATESKIETNYKNGYGDVKMQYPFGYGLSYTSFKYSKIKSPKKVNINDNRFNISLKVKNTGGYDGAEIVQLYVSPKDPNSSLKFTQLKGFKRLELKAGEEKTVTFKVSPEQLAQYKNQQWIVEGGSFDFKIGSSSSDIRLSKVIKIEGEYKILPKGRSVFFSLVE